MFDPVTRASDLLREHGRDDALEIAQDRADRAILIDGDLAEMWSEVLSALQEMQEPIPTADELYALYADQLRSEYHLFYVDRDDELPEPAVDLLLDGDVLAARDHLHEYVWETIAEGSWYAVTEELVTNAEHREILEDADQLQELRYAIEERDVSDPFAEVLRNTPDVFVRFDTGYAVETNYASSAEDQETTLREIADHLSIDLETNRAALTEMTLNAISGGELYVIWSADLTELQELQAGVSVLEWTDPHLVVLSSWNGSGWEAQITGTVRLRHQQGALTRDNAGPGYGWSEVCGGLIRSYYATSVTVDNSDDSAERAA